jgi:hypothetical protein
MDHRGGYNDTDGPSVLLDPGRHSEIGQVLA